MNSLTTSAFDLPGQLAAKADPALIAGDERHVAAVAESLERSIADLSARPDAERGARGGLGQEALDRDMKIHRPTARLGALRRFGPDLCLGRIVSAEGHPPSRLTRKETSHERHAEARHERAPRPARRPGDSPTRNGAR